MTPMTTPRLILTPRRSALLAEHDNTLEILVRLQAPELAAEERPKRPPLQVALVLDRSGSMSGPPLIEARRCAQFVIDGLDRRDRASLVVYDHFVETLVETREVGDRSVFSRALDRLESGGTTNLHGGWKRGAKTLKRGAGNNVLSRVILVSDGCANHGLTDPRAIERECRTRAEAGITTSTYGLGYHFNEELMVAMAQAGQGNHYYGQTAEDLMDPFREELALLNSLCARGIELDLEAPRGIELEVMNAYTKTGRSSWRLPDLAHGAEAWALVRLVIPKARVAEFARIDGSSLLEVRVRYKDLGGMHLATERAGVSLPVLGASAFHAIAEDATVKRRVEELEVARIQDAARKAALEGDWTRVEGLLERVRALGAENDWVCEVEKELRELAQRRDQGMFAKETLYCASRMRGRLASVKEVEDGLGAAVPSFLRRKFAQGKGRPAVISKTEYDNRLTHKNPDTRPPAPAGRRRDSTLR